MPLRPILEVFVVWHPLDAHGGKICDWLVEHFQGPAYAGLAGGSVAVYPRSAPWEGEDGPPRPLPVHAALPAGMARAQMTVVLLYVAKGLSDAKHSDPRWRRYLKDLHPYLGGDRLAKEGVAVFALLDPDFDAVHSPLRKLLVRQPPEGLAAADRAVIARELGQAIVQSLGGVSGQSREGPHRYTIFISHTKHDHDGIDPALEPPHARVRRVIADTHLDGFYDAHDLQVGDDWNRLLRKRASTAALLMVRTDRYSGREWTQREVLLAKRNDVPVVALHAFSEADDRGSFLMDNVPVIPCPPPAPPGADAERVRATETAMDAAVSRALNRLVDEGLKRVVWRHARDEYYDRSFDWLPAHAPEPITLGPWLAKHRKQYRKDPHVWIMHPDPPLGPEEHAVLVGLCRLAHFKKNVDVVTPRTFAARGGRFV